MRHTIHNLGPIFGLVMPERRQRVALDATVDQKRSAFLQQSDIDRSSLNCSCHLWSGRRNVVDRFASDQTGNNNQEAQHPFHRQKPIPKIVRSWKSASSGVFVACARAVTVTNQFLRRKQTFGPMKKFLMRSLSRHSGNTNSSSIAVYSPVPDPVKTAQAVDTTMATDAVAAPPRTEPKREPETTQSISAEPKLAEPTPPQGEPADMAAKAAETDPGLIEDGKIVAAGVAAGNEAVEPSAAIADVETTTGTIAAPAPPPAKVEAAAPAPVKTEPAKTAPTSPLRPSRRKSHLYNRQRGPENFASKLWIPSIIATKPAPPLAPAPVIATPAAQPLELSDSPAIALDDVPVPQARPADIAKILSERAGPVAIFISRKTSKIYVRQRFAPVFDAPITIANPSEPLGTHVFTAMNFLDDNATFRWTAITLPAEQPKLDRQTKEEPAKGKRKAEPAAKPGAEPQPNAHDVLARIDIPQDVVDRISAMMIPGSSLIVSDKGIGDETGEGTDFIVVTR